MDEKKLVQGAKELALEDCREGMILSQPVMQDGKILVGADFVLTGKMLERLGRVGVKTVFIRSKVQSEAPVSVQEKMTPGFIPPGTFICLQGDRSEHIYILDEGELEVMVYTGDHVTPENVVQSGKVVAVLKGKKINFGEIGAILGIPRSASIRARTAAKITKIPVSGKALIHSVQQNPRLGLNIAVSLTGRLKETNQRINVISQLNREILEKLEYNAKAFLLLCNRFAERRKLWPQAAWLAEAHEKAKQSRFYTVAIKFGKKTAEKQAAAVSQENRLDDLEFDLTGMTEFESGETVCREGEEGKEMFILVSGRLGVFVGESRVASIERRGELIGEMAVLLGHQSGSFEKRTATIRAVSDCQLKVIPGNELESYVQRDPGVMAHILCTLAQRLPAANQAYLNLKNDTGNQLDVLKCGFDFRIFSDSFEGKIDREKICPEELKLSSVLSRKIEKDMSECQGKFDSLENLD